MWVIVSIGAIVVYCGEAKVCYCDLYFVIFFFFSSRRRHTRFDCDWSSDVCSSDLTLSGNPLAMAAGLAQLRELERIDGWSLLEKLGAQFEAATRDALKDCKIDRSEERRVGKECRSRWSPYH